LVLDTSVAVKFHVPEEHHEEARKLQRGFEHGAVSLLAPGSAGFTLLDRRGERCGITHPSCTRSISGTLTPGGERRQLPVLRVARSGGLAGGLYFRYPGGVELAHSLAAEAFEIFEAPLGFADEFRDVEAQGFGLELVEAFDAAT
jgi:hypothetical protein